MEKKCPDCQFFLHVVEFGRDKHRPDGLSRRCKPCGRKYWTKQRVENPDRHRSATARWREKNLDRINAYQEANKHKAIERAKKWDAENPEKSKERYKRYKAKNKDKISASQRAYRSANVELIGTIKRDWNNRNAAKNREYGVRRRRSAKYKIEAAIRSRINVELRGAKSKRTFDLLGYNSEQLREHLQRQFLPKMSWDNYGEWHVDHILPLASFEYSSADDDNFKAAWALANLRPIWKRDNIVKGAKRLTLL